MHSFRTVSDIRIEPGGTARLDAHVAGLPRNKRIAIVTDKGVRSLGLLDAGLAALKDAGYQVMVFDEVVADPPEDVVISGAEAVQQFGAGLVIGFGGGSPMDTAKIIAFLADNETTLPEIYGVDVAQGPRLPLLLIPTTSGTGSEVTNVAVITTGKGSKNAVVSDPLYADRVLLDADLTLGLPGHITAATGIDAMVHAIEAYTSIHRKNPISDALGLSALRKLTHAISRAVNTPADIEAREDMLIGAMLAGQAFSNAPVGAVHGLAYPLGGFFHVPHGLSNSLVMVEVMKFNAQEERAKRWYSEIARDLGVGDSPSALIDEILRLQDETRVQRRLRDVNINADAIPMMADDAILKDRVLRNNPRSMTRADIVKIYETIA
ncbi:alcohol dehydrogenase [Algimonas ampicilliniresistens]|uniref:Alcohol dehydrogenase n=1 Tax=Algimonas ampicilliniresistens TaxID=1298735 RepID=A0ABQ5V643_9PROT|nr:iron-containing alcohol dehydrogenase [Algimonas ampicilliniresistens]GLQ22948.1 alcohol dehydrogenase [Algimonas ampicilliniresistens]